MSVNATADVRLIVKGLYALQKLRIQSGNRIVAAFFDEIGKTNSIDSEATTEGPEAAALLKQLKESYRRLTDGVVASDSEIGVVIAGKVPSIKQFDKKASDLSKDPSSGFVPMSYGRFILVDQYVSLLAEEEKQYKLLGKILELVPIYTSFLKNITGVGPAMAGVLVSELDIHKAKYPSSFHKFAGLDVVSVCMYTDGDGVQKPVPSELLAEAYEKGVETFLVAGKYPVTVEWVGRSRKSFCLEQREYINREGVQAVRNSITFSPFLKTKLTGVLGSSFLKQRRVYVDGVLAGKSVRVKMAEALGFVVSKDDDGMSEADAFLRSKGHMVDHVVGKYAQVYYNYKNRINNMPAHDAKTDAHKHNMAVRYMLKIFLTDLYVEMCKVEGITPSPDYATAKLGFTHGINTHAKEVANV